MSRLKQIREVIRDAMTIGAEDALAIALHTLHVEFPNAGLADPAESLSADALPEWGESRTAQKISLDALMRYEPNP